MWFSFIWLAQLMACLKSVSALVCRNKAPDLAEQRMRWVIFSVWIVFKLALK